MESRTLSSILAQPRSSSSGMKAHGGYRSSITDQACRKPVSNIRLSLSGEAKTREVVRLAARVWASRSFAPSPSKCTPTCIFAKLPGWFSGDDRQASLGDVAFPASRADSQRFREHYNLIQSLAPASNGKAYRPLSA